MIAVSTEEERSRRGPDAGKPHAPFRTWDVTDPTRPKLLHSYYLPESATPYRGDKVRFGTHQLREQIDKDCLAFVTWFAGGLRIMDISDPSNPKERGYFIPEARRWPGRAADQRCRQGFARPLSGSPTRRAGST